MRSSPCDWPVHRDSVLRDMLIDWEGKTFLLTQAQSDESLWFIKQKGRGPIAGTIVIYVDDLSIFAIRALCSAVLDANKKIWQLSELRARFQSSSAFGESSFWFGTPSESTKFYRRAPHQVRGE